MLAVEENNRREEGPAGCEGKEEGAEVKSRLFGEEDPEDLGASDAGGGYSNEIGDGAEEEAGPGVHKGGRDLADQAGGAEGGEESEEKEREDGRWVRAGGIGFRGSSEGVGRGGEGGSVEAGEGMEGAHGLPSLSARAGRINMCPLCQTGYMVVWPDDYLQLSFAIRSGSLPSVFISVTVSSFLSRSLGRMLSSRHRH